MGASIKQSAITTIRQAAEKWPTSWVARTKCREFTGGVYSPGYLANCDSAGTGPKERFRIGRQNCYPVNSFCDWLIEKIVEETR